VPDPVGPEFMAPPARKNPILESPQRSHSSEAL
jgi:hypothetical protein